MTGDGGEILDRAREVLRVEGEAVLALVDRVGPPFRDAVERIREAQGRVVVSGLGKSGVVARKIASTLASTGTPAVFLHPVEGAHGELGLVVRGDVLLVVSKSGETRELSDLLPVVQRMGVPVLAITGAPSSTLARRADVVLDAGVSTEACPLDLAPTASSTAALALGDALAMSLLSLRGFEAEDIARIHPGGSLGRRLLWTVRDAMVDDPEEVPAVEPGTPLSETMREIAFRRGTVPVLEEGGRRVVGVVTAGDLTRFAESRPDFLERPTREAMTADPHLTRPDTAATEARRVMEEQGIMAMPVVDGDGALAGIVHLHDLLRAGLA